MKVEVTVDDYNDTEKKRKVFKGETFTVNEKRGRQLIEAGVAKEVSEASFSNGKNKSKKEKE